MRPLLPILLITIACASAPPAETKTEAKALPLDARCGDIASFSQEAPLAAGAPKAEALARAYVATCGLAETIELTKQLVAFPTVSSEQSAAEGPAFAAMRAFLETWAKDAGLEFEAVGKNDVWILSYGQGAPSVGFIMHGDVVPVGEPKEWSVPPFEVTTKDDRLYGRGTEDDKGAIASVLVVLRTLSRFGVKPNGKLQAIIGLGEEHAWEGMVTYAKSAPHPRFPISIDANFPVVVAENGFVIWKLVLPLDAPKTKAKPKKKCIVAKSVSGGNFLTQVPGEAKLELDTKDLAAVQAAAAAESAARGAPFVITAEATAEGTRLHATGASVHSSVAEEGHNALWALAGAAGRLELCPGGATEMLAVLRAAFDADHFGAKLGVGYDHPLMGKLMVAPTVLRTDKGEVVLEVNMRRPAGPTAEEFGKSLDTAFTKLKTTAPRLVEKKDDRYVGNPAVADTTGPLASTLLAIYQKAANDEKAQAVSIRGGTYARLFPGAVSFGPSLPGRPYRGHAPDEYVEIPALLLMLHTQLDAILKLDALPPTAPAVTAK